MFHTKVTLPESHPDYPSVAQSQCGDWRVIRCPDDLQWIVQHYRSPKWRNKSYHTDWQSIYERWGKQKPFVTLPTETPQSGLWAGEP